MRNVYEYETKQGKRYYVRYLKPDGTRANKRGFTRKRDAAAFLASVKVDIRRQEYIDPRSGDILIAQLGEAWISEQRTHLKPSTLHSVESAWRTHVRSRWGRVKVSDVRHGDIRAWVADLATERSASTVLRAHGVLSGILDVAARDRRIPVNPAVGVPMPRKNRKRRVYLSHAQVAELAQEARFPELVYFLAYTGLRWGEATALRNRHVDLNRGRVFVEENAVRVSGRTIVGTPKTHVTRTVPIPRFLLPYFDETATIRGPEGLVFGDGASHLILPNSKDGWFAAAVRRCQRKDARFPRVTPHDLRHTTASLAISSGANVKAVQRLLGHASAAMTLDTYADLFEDDLDAVALALEAARRNASVREVSRESVPILSHELPPRQSKGPVIP